MGQYCFARWCLLSVVCRRRRRRLSGSVTLPAGRPAGRRARRRSGDRHSTAGGYGYVPLLRYLARFEKERRVDYFTKDYG